MILTDLPQEATDIRIKSGQVVHFKLKLTVTGPTRLDVLRQVGELGDGKLESHPAKIGTEWRAIFVQAFNKG